MHTPGPWAVCTVAPNPYWFVGRSIGAANPNDGRRICDLPVLASNDMNVANGRLIAAAPELLYAAKRALNVLKAQGETPTKGNVLGALQFAIDKATLEPT